MASVVRAPPPPSSVLPSRGRSHRKFATGVDALLTDNRRRDVQDVVDAGLVKQERLQLHLASASNPCVRIAERGLRETTDGAVGLGAVHSDHECIAAIERHLQAHDDNTERFVWSTPADSLLHRVAGCTVVSEAVL